MSMQDWKLIRVDKNGTEIYHNYTCPRCGGQGGRDEWAYTGFTCYECGGSGIASKPSVWKKYTPEYEAKLLERRKKAHEKKEAEIEASFQENKAQRQAEWKRSHGFGEFTFIYSKDTPKEALQAERAKWDETLGWHSAEPIEGLKCLPVSSDVLLIAGETHNDPVYSYVEDAEDKANKARLMLNPTQSQWLGEVGSKITVKARFEHSAGFQSCFNGWRPTTTYIVVFVDESGNKIVWKSQSPDALINGEKRHIPTHSDHLFEITGTVKEHNEYKGEKQTILTRCKVIALEGGEDQ